MHLHDSCWQLSHCTVDLIIEYSIGANELVPMNISPIEYVQMKIYFSLIIESRLV